MTHPDLKAALLLDQIERFTSDNKDIRFTLVAFDESLEISRTHLVNLLAKVRKDKRFLDEVRYIFHELVK